MADMAAGNGSAAVSGFKQFTLTPAMGTAPQLVQTGKTTLRSILNLLGGVGSFNIYDAASVPSQPASFDLYISNQKTGYFLSKNTPTATTFTDMAIPTSTGFNGDNVSGFGGSPATGPIYHPSDGCVYSVIHDSLSVPRIIKWNPSTTTATEYDISGATFYTGTGIAGGSEHTFPPRLLGVGNDNCMYFMVQYFPTTTNYSPGATTYVKIYAKISTSGTVTVLANYAMPTLNGIDTGYRYITTSALIGPDGHLYVCDQWLSPTDGIYRCFLQRYNTSTLTWDATTAAGGLVGVQQASPINAYYPYFQQPSFSNNLLASGIVLLGDLNFTSPTNPVLVEAVLSGSTISLANSQNSGLGYPQNPNMETGTANFLDRFCWNTLSSQGLVFSAAGATVGDTWLYGFLNNQLYKTAYLNQLRLDGHLGRSVIQAPDGAFYYIGRTDSKFYKATWSGGQALIAAAGANETFNYQDGICCVGSTAVTTGTPVNGNMAIPIPVGPSSNEIADIVLTNGFVIQPIIPVTQNVVFNYQ